MTETGAVGHVAAVAAVVEHAAVLVVENVAVVVGHAVAAAVVGHVAAVAAALEYAAVLAAENDAVVGHAVVAAVVGRVVAEAVQNAAVAEVENAVVLVLVGFVYRRVGPAVHGHEQQLQEAKTKRKYLPFQSLTTPWSSRYFL